MIPNSELIGHILDNDCAPESPLEIRLHCTTLCIHWERISSGYWDDKNVYHVGQYIIHDIKVEG